MNFKIIGKKIRIVTLGCGAKLPEAFMKEGSSTWLDSIHILYSTEEIDFASGYSESKYVSEQRVAEVLEELPHREDTFDIVLSASLYSEGQREGRVNQFYYATKMQPENPMFDRVVVNTGQNVLEEKSRNGNEYEVRNFIVALCAAERARQTLMVYSGSFNPFHDGHAGLLKCAEYIKDYKKISLNPITIQISKTHPTKGVLPDGEMAKRFSNVEKSVAHLNNKLARGFYVSHDVTEVPKFIDKFHHEIKVADGRIKSVVFIIGNDVWDKYKDSFLEEFEGLECKFLVGERDCRKTPREMLNEYKKYSKILHIESWNFTSFMDDDKLKLSSTEIRNK